MMIRDVPIAIIILIIAALIFLFTLGKIEGDNDFLGDDEINAFGGDEKKLWLLMKKKREKKKFDDEVKSSRKKKYID